jgi:hypothetical protein
VVGDEGLYYGLFSFCELYGGIGTGMGTGIGIDMLIAGRGSRSYTARKVDLMPTGKW